MTRLALTPRPSGATRFGPLLPFATRVGFWTAIAAIVVVVLLSFGSLRASLIHAKRVINTSEVIEQLQTVLSTLKDAETGQRGFLLTGDERYLAPYTIAEPQLTGEIATARALLVGNPEQERRLQALEQLCAAKTAELARTIALRRQGHAEDALAIVRTDRGRELMESIRTSAAEMNGEARRTLAARQDEWLSGARISSFVTVGGAAFLLACILAAALRTSRDHRARQIQAWIRAGQVGLGERIHGGQRLDKLADRALGFLAQYLDAQAGAFYLTEPEGRFRRLAGYGLAAGPGLEGLHPGNGLLEQVVNENRAVHVQDEPAAYMAVGSSPGRSEPTELLVAPASVDAVVHAVIELHFSRHLEAADHELLSRASESLGMAVRSSKNRIRLEELLEETRQQGAELRTQQDELRVSNEELKRQALSLRESRLQTQTQRAQIARTNDQLEEQTQILKQQKDQLSIFNSANFTSIATDARGVIQVFNVGAERMLGYTAAEVLNRITPAEISDPQEVIARAKALSVELDTPIAPGFQALVVKASRGAEDIYELTYIRKDGSRFPAVVSVTALRAEDNEITGYLLISTDNTARKRAEEELFRAGALQRAIFDSANFSKIATDAKGVIQLFNVGAERMLGYTAEEVLNKITPADISDPQEVIARAETLSAELQTAIAPGFEALVFKASRGIEDIYELTYIRKDGSRFPRCRVSDCAA